MEFNPSKILALIFEYNSIDSYAIALRGNQISHYYLPQKRE